MEKSNETKGETSNDVRWGTETGRGSEVSSKSESVTCPVDTSKEVGAESIEEEEGSTHDRIASVCKSKVVKLAKIGLKKRTTATVATVVAPSSPGTTGGVATGSITSTFLTDTASLPREHKNNVGTMETNPSADHHSPKSNS